MKLLSVWSWSKCTFQVLFNTRALFSCTRSVERRKSEGEFCHLHNILSSSRWSLKGPGHQSQQNCWLFAAFLPQEGYLQSPICFIIFKLCSKMKGITKLQFSAIIWPKFVEKNILGIRGTQILVLWISNACVALPYAGQSK